MNARWRGWRNALVLIAALLALWQVLYAWVGDAALASPLATLRYTARMVSDEAFAGHVYDTMRAFAIAFAFSVAIGLVVGFWLGFQRTAGDTLEPLLIPLCIQTRRTPAAPHSWTMCSVTSGRVTITTPSTPPGIDFKSG